MTNATRPSAILPEHEERFDALVLPLANLLQPGVEPDDLTLRLYDSAVCGLMANRLLHMKSVTGELPRSAVQAYVIDLLIEIQDIMAKAPTNDPT